MSLYDTHLVSEHYLCRKVVVGGNTCKRITLMTQCLVEVLAGLVEELHHTLLLNESAQRQRVYKHTHGVADTQVGTSVTDGCDAQLLVVGEA